MALSDYELRILREIETDLSRPDHPRWAGTCGLLREHWVAITIDALALAVIILLAVFAPAVVAAAVAGVCAGLAGYLTCASRHRADRWNH
jgi:Flp pilus assembly protein TadB